MTRVAVWGSGLWEYEKVSGWWVPMSDEYCSLHEGCCRDGYSELQYSIESKDNDGNTVTWEYSMNFSTMVQTNTTLGVSRKVRRLEVMNPPVVIIH